MPLRTRKPKGASPLFLFYNVSLKPSENSSEKNSTLYMCYWFLLPADLWSDHWKSSSDGKGERAERGRGRWVVEKGVSPKIDKRDALARGCDRGLTLNNIEWGEQHAGV